MANGKPRSRGQIEEASGRREAILNAAEQIMREEGYAAVTSRKVAATAGLKSQLVHYYFQSMDELFLSLFRRVDARFAERIEQAVRSDRPLQTLWKIQSDPRRPRLTAEFIALANHRAVIRDEISRTAERNRSIQAALISRVLEERGLSAEVFPPVALALIMTGISQAIASEAPLGIKSGHQPAIALVNRLAQALEDHGSLAELLSLNPKQQ